MQTQKDIIFKEDMTKKVPLSPEVFRKLKRRAKAQGITPDKCAERLLLGAMIDDHVPALCPYCKETILIPTQGPPITKEAFQQLYKEDLLESKRVAVPMDADLLAEAKKYDVNIEEAARKHFEKVKDDYLLDMICGSSEVRIEGELLKDFEAVKKHYGLKEDINVIRKLIGVAYEDLVARGVKFS